MGYHTYFKGSFKIYPEVTREEILFLKSFLGEDARKHPEWENAKGLYWIDLMLSEDETELFVDPESEKPYAIEDQLSMILSNMRIFYPEFRIIGGCLIGQGEEPFDRYKITITQEQNIKFKWIIDNDGQVLCPCCKTTFKLE